jgi:hypothetical protein
MSAPTPTDMAKYCIEQLSDDDEVLRCAVFGLHRALHLHGDGESAEDLPQSAKELLVALDAYMGTVNGLVEYAREAFGEERGEGEG